MTTASGAAAPSSASTARCPGEPARTGSIESDDDDLEPLYGAAATSTARSRRRRNILGGAAALLISAACIVGVIVLGVQFWRESSSGGGHAERRWLVNTTCGPVSGQAEGGITTFKGIPYAVPPVGFDGRWAPPQPLTGDNCWEEPYMADKFSSPCCQESYHVDGCEDCLYLNVWTPAAAVVTATPNDKLRPVMVYLHGGGLMEGSGHQDGFVPSPQLVASSRSVFVSLNYRLGVLGFLALRQLSEVGRRRQPEGGKTAPPPGASGNYGFMDQVLALQWVKNNIRSFGGDPEKVTLFGTDSGATSILALLSAPPASTLFHRAWLMSPSPRFEATRSQAEAQNDKGFLRQVLSSGACGAEDADELVRCLLALAPAELVAAGSTAGWGNPDRWGIPTVSSEHEDVTLAIVDGVFLEKAPHEAWKAGSLNQVPILVGSTAEEMELHPAPPGGDSRLNASTYRQHLREHLPYEVWTEVADQLYRAEASSARCQLAQCLSDMRLTCGTNELIKVAAFKSSAPVYRYVLSSMDCGAGAAPHYAFQGADTRAFFGSLTWADGQEVDGLTATLRKVVGQFVVEGNIAEWKQFPDSTAVITLTPGSAEVSMVDGSYHQQACDFFRMQGLFPRFAWVN